MYYFKCLLYLVMYESEMCFVFKIKYIVKFNIFVVFCEKGVIFFMNLWYIMSWFIYWDSYICRNC